MFLKYDSNDFTFYQWENFGLNFQFIYDIKSI